ncbi:hypothetical protein KNV05_gp040 [Vibrio phage River4]|uniref:Uncharacterized protein n=1 Tax=Vibrio phage River4 TaxID=2736288 RepID=A0A6M9YZW9_9CAUD|nr:hypothetical protein KNV05_gp040 [Vibrio phage River4]QKN84702.1 hypothetical protein RIVER4_40 [Vibrio phage River4]
MKVNISGSWKNGIPWVNIGGTWRKGIATWVNISGTWKKMAYAFTHIVITQKIIEKRFGSNYSWESEKDTVFTKDPSDYPLSQFKAYTSKNKYTSKPSAAWFMLTFSDKTEADKMHNLFKANKVKLSVKAGFDQTYTTSNTDTIKGSDLIQFQPKDKLSAYNLIKSSKNRTLTFIIDYI